MTEPGSFWGADVPISMPEPNPDNEVILDMGAHGIGIYGLSNNLSESDISTYLVPTFSPDVNSD